jgi:hypothetical protein
MSTTGRPCRRPSSVRHRRKSFFQPERCASRRERPLVGAERLETRTVLTDGFVAPGEFYNYVFPTDVNNDGRASTSDLLVLVNSLTITGPRRLSGGDAPASAGAAGEGEGPSTTSDKMYIDPNNDDMLNTLDLLTLVNEMSGEGEDPVTLVRYSFVPVAAGTNNPITTIPEGGHYELRVMVQDLGVLQFMGDTRNANQVGVASSFLDMFWDRSQTDVQVNETQTVQLQGSPSATTRFTLTFTDIDNTTQTTGPITFATDREVTAVNIRTALVNLSKIGNSIVGSLPNIEVVPSTQNNRTFTIRFINDEANKNFNNLGGNVTVAGGATGITITETVAGNPASLVSFQEMFRPRPVRDASFNIINDDVNDKLYYEVFFGTGRPFSSPEGATTIRNAGGDIDFLAVAQGGPRPLTQVVEVFRLRMTAKESGGTAVQFTGAYPQVTSGLSVLVLGDATGGGPWSTAIPAANVQHLPGSISVTELVSAVTDNATMNEAAAPLIIDVLANDLDNNRGTQFPNFNLELLQTPILPPGFQGTVEFRAANTDGLPRAHFRYTLPNADFNGPVTFQYTVRDGNTNVPVGQRPTDVGTVNITVNPINDAPVNTVPGAQSVAEDAPSGLVFAGATAISIGDVDAGGASVSIRLQATNGTLHLAALPPGLAITGDGTSDLIIVGSIANINPALSGLRYQPTLNYNGPAQITVTTNDNGATGSSTQQGNNGTPPDPLADVDTIAITVTPTNDAPLNTVPGAQQVDESAQLSFAGGIAISVDDPDLPNVNPPNPTNPNLTVTLSTNSTQGATLSATATGGAGVTGDGTQTLVVSGTETAVNSTLATLKFNAGLPEFVTLTVLTSDNGNIGPGGPLTDTDPIQIEVVATVRPRANPNTYSLAEGPTFFDLNSPSVLANDLANAGAQVTLEGVGTPSVGSVIIVDAGVPGDKRDDIIRYTPPSTDFFGQVTFTYNIFETPVTGLTTSGPNLTATVTLNILDTPDVPVANPDGPYNTDEHTVLSVNAASGVLANDTDADNLVAPFNAGLTAQLTAQPPAGEGTVNLAGNGSFTWTPPAGQNFFGTTTFRYVAVDPQSNQSAEATVTIEVASVNDAPVAANDGPGGAYVTDEDVPLTITLPTTVLSNDTDVETHGSLSAVIVPGSATNGTVTLNADGTFTFTPNEHFNSGLGQGAASFQYRANDNDPVDPKLSSPATVTITVNPVNDVPVANPAEFTVEEGAVLSRTAANGLRLSVTDPDQPGGFTGSINLVAGSGPTQGTLVLNADGSFSYTPPATVVNPFDVTFRYTATDTTNATSNEATVTIHVIPFNDPPVAVGDGPYAATEDQDLVVSAANGVLNNDSDEETPNSGLTAILVQNVPAAAGSVTLNADGSFTYDPAANFFTQPRAVNTPISFTYKIRDGLPNEGGKESNTVTVTITVEEANDNPVANPDTADPVIRNFTNQLLPSALANDNAGVDIGRVPAEVLAITLVGGSPTQTTTTAGNVVRLVGQDLFYDDNIGHLGLDTFQYTIGDGRGGTATATYTVNVVEFVPKDVSGVVRIDGKPLAGVEVRLNGTNVLGIPAFAQVVVFTDAEGRYSFDDLRPGNYTVTEVTPKFIKDGADLTSHPSPLVTSFANDLYTLVWDTPLSITTGAINGLDFNELRIDAAQLDDASGVLGEILASSGQSGMVLAVGPNNTVYWSYTHSGWSTTAQIQLEFGAGGSIPSCLVTVNGITKRIYQDPSNNTGTGSPSSPAAGSMARFRIIGTTNAGEYIIRLDGTLSDFGFVASTGGPPESGAEGEAGPPMSDGEFRESADQVFAESAWA